MRFLEYAKYFASNLQLAYQRRVFNARQREQTWRLVGDLVAADIALNKAMQTAARTAHAQGQKTLAAILLDIEAGIARREVPLRVARYVRGPEALVFQAIGQSDATSMFRAAARLAAQQYRIRAAITSALAMPAVLCAMMIVLLFILGTQLFPAMESIGGQITLSWSAALMSRVSQWFVAHALWVFVPLFVSILAIAWAMPGWYGWGRTWADKIPPFSLYKLAQGSGFMFTVIELGRMGQTLGPRLLADIGVNASPYTKRRIQAISKNLAAGRWGDAMHLAGHQFPAVDLITVTQAMDGTDNWIERFAVFLDRWLEQLEDRVKAQVRILNALLMFAITAMMVMIGSTMMSVFSLTM